MEPFRTKITRNNWIDLPDGYRLMSNRFPREGTQVIVFKDETKKDVYDLLYAVQTFNALHFDPSLPNELPKGIADDPLYRRMAESLAEERVAYIKPTDEVDLPLEYLTT